MRVGYTRYSVVEINEKEAMLLAEIGLEEVPTATDFVCYFSEKYAVSQSGVWYILKKLKAKGLVDFTERGQEFRPLGLTKGGLTLLRSSAALPQRQSYLRNGLNLNV